MRSNRYFVLVFLLPLLGLSWLVIAVLDPGLFPIKIDYILVGFILGSLFGQTTLAAAWNAWGPLPLVWRLPLSLGWVALVLVAFLMQIVIHQGVSNFEFPLMMGIGLAGQWVLVQLPLWALVTGYGIRLRHSDDVSVATPRDRQFGIRQLMILTAIVAVVLGVFRWIIVMTKGYWDAANFKELPILIALIMAGIAMTLPLLMAAMLPRLAVRASVVVVGLISLGTWWELPLLNRIGTGPDIWLLTFINAFQAAWIIAVVAILRLCGYTTAKCEGESPFAADRQ